MNVTQIQDNENVFVDNSEEVDENGNKWEKLLKLNMKKIFDLVGLLVISVLISCVLEILGLVKLQSKITSLQT